MPSIWRCAPSPRNRHVREEFLVWYLLLHHLDLWHFLTFLVLFYGGVLLTAHPRICVEQPPNISSCFLIRHEASSSTKETRAIGCGCTRHHCPPSSTARCSFGREHSLYWRHRRIGHHAQWTVGRSQEEEASWREEEAESKAVLRGSQRDQHDAGYP